ncbi:MAG: 50S ribosomal protein L4 [Dehalococcoidia bacterium]|nr:50S ribosomal protein L4 [Dehalococcoidia bacterium]
MQIPVYNLSGAITKEINISDDVFAVPFNESVVHQAMVRQLANRRLGLADTKTRGEVSGSTRKLYQQKHTGRARRGSIKSPLLRGGGIVFGPHPRDHHQDIPKKMRRLALRCLLSDKAREGDLKVVEKLDIDAPKTRYVASILENLKTGDSVLIATVNPNPEVIVAARNLPGVKTTVVSTLNVLDLLTYKVLLTTEDAIRKAEELWAPRTAKAGTAG